MREISKEEANEEARILEEKHQASISLDLEKIEAYWERLWAVFNTEPEIKDAELRHELGLITGYIEDQLNVIGVELLGKQED